MHYYSRLARVCEIHSRARSGYIQLVKRGDCIFDSIGTRIRDVVASKRGYLKSGALQS
jgi:hypothetical protein